MFLEIFLFSYFTIHFQVRFTSYTGKKDIGENLAYLPTTINNVNETLQLAQWNFRILCHPLKHYISPSRLGLVDDLSSRMAYDRDMEEHAMSRAARFVVC